MKLILPLTYNVPIVAPPVPIDPDDINAPTNVPALTVPVILAPPETSNVVVGIFPTPKLLPFKTKFPDDISVNCNKLSLNLLIFILRIL